MNAAHRLSTDVKWSAAKAKFHDPKVGAPAPDKWNADTGIQISMSSFFPHSGRRLDEPPVTAYPVHTRVILPDESGTVPPQPLFGTIKEFIAGKGVYVNPLTAFNPSLGDEDDLPHYMIEYVSGHCKDSESGGRFTCMDIHQGH